MAPRSGSPEVGLASLLTEFSVSEVASLAGNPEPAQLVRVVYARSRDHSAIRTDVLGPGGLTPKVAPKARGALSTSDSALHIGVLHKPIKSPDTALVRRPLFSQVPDTPSKWK